MKCTFTVTPVVETLTSPSCDFEADMCSFIQSADNDVDLIRFITPTPSIRTGPDSGFLDALGL